MGRATRWLKGLFRIKSTNPDRSSDDDPQRRSITGLCYNEIESLRASLSDVAEDARRTRPYYYCSEKQSKNTMAVAAATSAAADAALAAARAAVAVVRLTGHARSALRFDQNAAAVMIQTVFRGYLARRALKALKGLVKVQAIVRGHLVRKQAMLTLKSMQTLIRLQSATRSRRSHRPPIKNPVHHQPRPSYISMTQPGERPVVFWVLNWNHSHGLEEKLGGATPTRRQSASSIPSRTTDESINGSRRNSPSHRRSSVNSLLEFTNSPNCYQTAHNSPSHFPGFISTPARHFNFLQEIHYEEFQRCSSAQITPRFANTTHSDDVFRQRSEHGGFVFPSYMGNTQSFNAKARSSSAPKQRVSRVSLHEVMELSRSSFSGVRMQRS